MAARERASAEDARAQAPGRLAAAAKAVASLRDGVPGPPADPAPLAAATTVATIDVAGTSGTADTAGATGTAVMASSAEFAESVSWEPVVDPERTDPDGGSDERPAVPVPTGGPAAVISKVFGAPGAPAPDPAVPDTPLLELRPSALGADVDQLGDQVLVYVDRIEHRDRHGRLKRRMSLRDVTEVEVHRRLTGTLLEVHSHAGVALVVKGLRPEAAEQARELIAAHRPQPRGVAAPAHPEFDEAGLLRKLVELYRAGVLDDQELAAKTEVVAAMAREVVALRTPTPPA
jgi:hypothetical protein